MNCFIRSPELTILSAHTLSTFNIFQLKSVNIHKMLSWCNTHILTTSYVQQLQQSPGTKITTGSWIWWEGSREFPSGKAQILITGLIVTSILTDQKNFLWPLSCGLSQVKLQDVTLRKRGIFVSVLPFLLPTFPRCQPYAYSTLWLLAILG